MQRNIPVHLNHRDHLSVVLAVLVLLAVACGSGGDEKTVRGQITSIEARSITEFDSLTIVDEEGRTWEFIGGAFAGFTPSHLREHMALGDPVKLWYVEAGEQMRVTRIEDG